MLQVKKLISILCISIGFTFTPNSPALAVEVPTLSNFPSIQFEFGSTTKYQITPPNSTSGGTWSYSSSNTKVAVINGDSIVPVGAGTSIISASQAATSNYSATSINTNLTILKGKPNIGTLNNINAVFTPPTSPGKYSKITLTTPYSNSPGAWTFTSLNPAVATISGKDLSIIGIGEAPIIASQAETSNFLASEPLKIIFSATGPAPALGAWLPIKIFLTDSPYLLVPPTSPSDGAWSYQLAKTDAAELNGDRLILKKAGNVVITATQSKSSNSLYGSTSASLKITIAKIIPTVGVFAPLVAYIGEPNVEIVDPPSNSSGTWSYSVSDPKIAKVKNGEIIPVAQGVVVVTAVQSATDFYDNSAPVQTELVIGAPLPLPVAGEFENLVTFVQTSPLKVTPPKSTSTGKWSYKSSNRAIISSQGGMLVPVAPGLVLVTASQSRTSQLGRIERKFQVKVGDPFTISAKGGKNVITISSSVPVSRVLIDDKSTRIGINKIGSGWHVVKVYIGGLLGYSTKIFVSGVKKV